jgi:hypothetical protein
MCKFKLSLDMLYRSTPYFLMQLIKHFESNIFMEYSVINQPPIPQQNEWDLIICECTWDELLLYAV